ncbi:helix-turn-helix domain-containing protein [Microbacterium sp.]|uniref:helix-turn-helix domain-containing protein n=1 Tax=Microbacterium sp. TaxID=51671 RepID=UPI00260D43AA|nr:helix-turn-helix domain-containing protein [Microbacterium sp.]
MEDISVITAVHHPLRRRIFDYLLLYGTAQVTAISRALASQVGSISHHLRMLERAGVVERVADPHGDRRTSWWKLSRSSMTWSADDYPDSPADALLAREADRNVIRRQIDRLQRWHHRRRNGELADYDGYNSETLGWATPDELSDLADRVQATVRQWHDEIDTDDGQTRTPVFFFARAFPTEP